MNAEVLAKPHAAYVERLRRRLAQPTIQVSDARDGVLDCFVATYQEGLAAGMHGIVGIDAGPDQVARVAASIFRRRLAEHGSSFEDPSVEALARVKQEADEELHFGSLPVEIQSTHDRVCELLLAKAEGSLPHAGDHSAVVGAEASVAMPAPDVGPRTRGTATTLTAPVVPLRPSRDARAPALPATTVSPLRQAVATLFEELAHWSRSDRAMDEVYARLEKARRLVETVRELETD